jgi:hypothetical protein
MTLSYAFALSPAADSDASRADSQPLQLFTLSADQDSHYARDYFQPTSFISDEMISRRRH